MRRGDYLVLGDGARYEWPVNVADKLVALWNEGHSASHICRLLSADGFFTTRNAIIGKVHRLKLVRHKAPHRERAKVVRKPRPKVERTVVVRLPSLPPPPPPEPWDGPCISMLDPNLSRFACREIVCGSGVDTMFCGAPTVPGSQFSYCAYHAQKNLIQAQRKSLAPRFVPYRVAA